MHIPLVASAGQLGTNSNFAFHLTSPALLGSLTLTCHIVIVLSCLHHHKECHSRESTHIVRRPNYHTHLGHQLVVRAVLTYIDSTFDQPHIAIMSSFVKSVKRTLSMRKKTEPESAKTSTDSHNAVDAHEEGMSHQFPSAFDMITDVHLQRTLAITTMPMTRLLVACTDRSSRVRWTTRPPKTHFFTSS